MQISFPGVPSAASTGLPESNPNPTTGYPGVALVQLESQYLHYLVHSLAGNSHRTLRCWLT